MTDRFWQLKTAAYLHDPPHKSLLLGRGIGHEAVALSLISAATGTTPSAQEWGTVKVADRIASAADRVDFPKDAEVYWSKRPVLCHPLSGERYDLGHLVDVDPQTLGKLVEQVVTGVRSKYGGNGQRTFLHLWRYLADDLKNQETSNKLGCLWDLLPADTRIPDHTIWHHNRIVSAIAGALPNPALLVMSIGPVQDFIACARTTRDLWTGSWLLSFLAWQGMKAISEEWGPDAILFPDLRGQPLVDKWLQELGIQGPSAETEDYLATPSLPNRWVAILPADAVRRVADGAEEVIKAAWRDLARQVKDLLGDRAKGYDLDLSQWQRQGDWVEVYWSSHAWPDVTAGVTPQVEASLDALLGPDQDYGRLLHSFRKSGKWEPNLGTIYGRLHSLVDRAHGSRKALRDFGGSESGEPGYKCTLCGVREPVRDLNTDSSYYRELISFWAKIGDDLGAGTVEENGKERLCTVCLTKRLAPKVLQESLGLRSAFPSTSEISATKYKIAVLQECIKNEELQCAVSEFVAAFPKDLAVASYVPAVGLELKKVRSLASVDSSVLERFAKIDGEWLFPETYESEESDHLLGENKATIARLAANLREKAKKAGITHLSPYYAVLAIDGDQMGKWVSGTHSDLPKIREVLHPDIVNLCSNVFGSDVLEQKRPQSPSLQGTLSSTLLGFSLYVARYAVEVQNAGKIVYSGGDDVLAFLPLEDALTAADDVRRMFQKFAVVSGDTVRVGQDLLRGDIGRSFRNAHLGLGNRITASAGIAVAHYRQPLRQVLDAARHMEEAAKESMGRSAFAVATLKHSGERTEAGAPWRVDDRLETIPFLMNLVALFGDEEGLSARLLPQLAYEITAYPGLPSEATSQRVEYLVKRHLGQGREELARAIARDICSLQEWFAGKGRGQLWAWEKALDLISLASFMARYCEKVVKN